MKTPSIRQEFPLALYGDLWGNGDLHVYVMWRCLYMREAITPQEAGEPVLPPLKGRGNTKIADKFGKI